MGRGKLSLKATIRLTLLLVASSVILTASALFGGIRSRDQAASASQQAGTIGEMAAEDLLYQLRHDPQMPLADWIKRAAAWPRVHGVAILQDNSLLAGDSDRVLTPERVRVGRHYNVPTMHWLDQQDTAGHPLAMQIQPVPSSQLNMKLLLAIAVIPDAEMASVSWGFFLPVAITGLLGVCIGILWLTHEVVRPIEMLSRIGTQETLAAQLNEPTGVLRYKELTQLAQSLRCLHVNLDQWRTKVDHLERSFDSRVEEQTRKIAKTLQRTQREMWRDPLTGLHNRRMLTENCPKILDEQIQARHDVSLVMLDVDHFKTLNDTLGHMAGDQTLQFLAELLKQAIRREDVAIRYGGDEFLLLLPGVPIDDAEQIAQRVVQLFRQHTRMLVDLDPKPSLSAGVASVAITGATTVEELMQLADKALYEAKRAGKNRVGRYDPHRQYETTESAPAPAAPAPRSFAAAGRRMLHSFL